MQDISLMEIEKTTLTQRTKNALAKNNIVLVGDLSKKTKPQLKKLKGVGHLGFAELTLFISSNKIKLSKTPPDSSAPFKKELISKFLKNPTECNWGNEFSVATRLIKKYPEKEFWEKFNITFKLNSLCFFLSEKGKEILDRAYYQPKTENKVQKQEMILSKEKTGEDIITNKPREISDFLNE